MIEDQYIARKRKEIKQLNRFRAHIPVLKVTMGLPYERIKEIEDIVNNKILICENDINYMNSKKI
jgi:hypothetical protein